MSRMRSRRTLPRVAGIIASVGLAASLVPAMATAQPSTRPAANPPTAGAKCTTAGRVFTETSGQQWTCTKQGAKLVWKLTKALPQDIGTQPIPKDGVWFTNPGFPKDLPPPMWRGPVGNGKGETPWFRYNWDVTTAAAVGPTCPAGSKPLTSYAMDIDRLDSITPQGFVQPGSHATPVPHMYYQTGAPSAADEAAGFVSERVPVYAMADMTLRGVAKSYSSGQDKLEYMLSFSVCGKIWVFHAHLGALVPKIMNAFPTAPNKEPMGCSGDACTMFYFLRIPFKAGDRIGTSSGWSGGFDVGLEDMSAPSPGRLDAKRWTPRWAASRCHIDYYADPAKREALEAKLSGPSCGQLASEKKGTAAGVWFTTADCPGSMPGSGCPAEREDYHLSLVRDTATASDWVFSVGTETGISGLGGAVYSFTPAASGSKNRNFDKVLTGTTACYDTLTVRGPNQPPTTPTVYLRLTKVDSDTERVTIWADETGVDCTTQSPPAGATTFERNTNTP